MIKMNFLWTGSCRSFRSVSPHIRKESCIHWWILRGDTVESCRKKIRETVHDNIDNHKRCHYTGEKLSNSTPKQPGWINSTGVKNFIYLVDELSLNITLAKKKKAYSYFHSFSLTETVFLTKLASSHFPWLIYKKYLF